ncbi:hypothetical protein J0J21_22930, partial [Vibrio vulnificus]|uniref:hypothetical protein n=1 Tax=Vibrio vulnificus TaxID=672 RepID=UPI0019D4A4DA
ESFELFKTHYKPSEPEKRFPALCSFSARFFLPWVCQWSIDFYYPENLCVLQRRFKVKWWTSFKVPEKLLKPAILEWLKKNSFLDHGPEHDTFLAQKSFSSA